MPRQRSRRMTDRFVNTDKWVGRIGRCFCPLMSVEDSESRRFELMFAAFFSSEPWPKICPGNNVLVFLRILELCF